MLVVSCLEGVDASCGSVVAVQREVLGGLERQSIADVLHQDMTLDGALEDSLLGSSIPGIDDLVWF